MKRILAILSLFAVLSTACTKRIYVPIEKTEYVTVRDSVYFRDTLIRIELEKARLADFVDVGDTLVLQTDLSRSTAYLDTTSGKLCGTLENIKKYAEKTVPLKEKIVYRDSISYKEIPVPVEVIKETKTTPRWAWYSLIFSIVCLLLGGFYAYIHLKP